MNDQRKTKAQLIQELHDLRHRLASADEGDSPNDTEGRLPAIARDISEHEQVEEELRPHSEIIKNMVEGVCLVGAEDGIIKYSNPKFEELFGYSEGEMVGQHGSIVNAPTDRSPEETAKVIMVILDKTGEWHGEVNNIKKDGTTFWCYANVSVFGHPKYGQALVAVHTDITAHKQAEEALKTSESMLQTSQRIGRIGSFEMDHKSGDILWSDQLYDLFGMKKTKGTIDYEKVLALIHPDDRERAIRVSGDAAKEGKPYELEHRVVHPNGKILDLLIKGDVIRNEKNQIIKTGGTVQDITQRKRAEEALLKVHEELELRVIERTNELSKVNVTLQDDIIRRKRAEMALKKSAESLVEAQKIALVGSWEWDLITDRGIWSEQIYRMFGFEEVEIEISFEWLLKQTHPDDRERVSKEIQRAVIEQRSIDMEYRVFRKDGSECTVHSLGRMRLDETGKTIGMMGVLQDITESKQVEEENERLIWNLQRTTSELETFNSVVSHDLKNPLVTIQGFLGLLQTELKDQEQSETVLQAIENMNSATRKMHALITDLVELSRIGRVIKADEQVPLAEITSDAVELLAAKIGETEAQVEIDPRLPTVLVDRGRMLQAMQNLIENAIKYTGADCSPEIKVGVRTDDGTQVIFVQDNGIGLNIKYAGRIFDPFHQLDPKQKGSGIGLMQVKKSSRLMAAASGWSPKAPARGPHFASLFPNI